MDGHAAIEVGANWKRKRASSDQQSYGSKCKSPCPRVLHLQTKPVPSPATCTVLIEQQAVSVGLRQIGAGRSEYRRLGASKGGSNSPGEPQAAPKCESGLREKKTER